MSGRENVNFYGCILRQGMGTGKAPLMYIFPKNDNNKTVTDKKVSGTEILSAAESAAGEEENMKMRIRAALLVLLAVTAAFTAMEAYSSLQPVRSDWPPEEMFTALFGTAEDAEYYLKNCDGFVAVYAGVRSRSPESITAIETSGLRGTDKAMLERGIPVTDKETLLALLEDLGS